MGYPSVRMGTTFPVVQAALTPMPLPELRQRDHTSSPRRHRSNGTRHAVPAEPPLARAHRQALAPTWDCRSGRIQRAFPRVHASARASMSRSSARVWRMPCGAHDERLRSKRPRNPALSFELFAIYIDRTRVVVPKIRRALGAVKNIIRRDMDKPRAAFLRCYRQSSGADGVYIVCSLALGLRPIHSEIACGIDNQAGSAPVNTALDRRRIADITYLAACRLISNCGGALPSSSSAAVRTRQQ